MEKVNENSMKYIIENKIPIFQCVKIGRLRNFITKDLKHTKFKYTNQYKS